MKNLIFLSTEPFSGKTGLALNLVEQLRDRGGSVGYFKPVGNLPTRINSHIIDQDALFAGRTLKMPEPPEEICPLILTSTAAAEKLRDGGHDVRPTIEAAYQNIASRYESIVLEGSGHINDGRLHDVSGVDLCRFLDTAAVLVVKLDNPYEIVDDVLVARDRLEDRLAGVLFNWVHQRHEQVIGELIEPYLERQGIRCFGMIPRDESLLAVTVDSLSQALGGRLLCAEDHGRDMVETFMVGAMGQEQALRFFRRKSHKAVITGGDRADVQMAALETPTTCLVLTGNYRPPATVLAAAESKGIPVVLVDMDTLSAIETMERLIGQMRVHDPGKLEAMRRRMEEHLDMERLRAVMD